MRHLYTQWAALGVSAFVLCICVVFALVQR